jgi:hypothetical protein
MTISSTTNRVSYTGNGATTAFSFPYKFLANADLVVIKRTIADGTEVVQTITTHYTVTGAGDANGGTVTMLSAPAATHQIIIYRDPAITQAVDLVENDSLPVEASIETPLDKLTMICQRLKDRLDRAFRLSDGDTTGGTTSVVPVANRALVFDASGDLTTSTYDPDALVTSVTASAAAAAADAVATAADRVQTGLDRVSTTASAASAAASALAAQTIVDSVGFRDVLFKTFADSPITVTQAMSGKLLAIDTSGGNVVVNLPSIAGLSLPYTVGVKKTTGDANTITTNRNGTDTFDDASTSKVTSLIGGLVTFEFGNSAIADGSITTAKLAAAVFNDLTSVTAVAGDYVGIADASDSGNKKKALVSDIVALGYITLVAEQASTSGTSIDFTSIPAGVKRITVMFNGVSTNATDMFLIQLGDAGGIETTGYKSGAHWYVGAAGGTTSTAGFIMGLTGGAAANTFHGALVLTRVNSTHTWVAQGGLSFADGNTGCSSTAGSKTLSAELDRVRVTMANGVDTFDLGSIGLMYEF